MSIRLYDKPADKSSNSSGNSNPTMAIRQYYRKSLDYDVYWIRFKSKDDMLEQMRSGDLQFLDRPILNLSAMAAEKVINGDEIIACTIALNDSYRKEASEYEFSNLDNKHLLAIFKESFKEMDKEGEFNSPCM